MDPWSYAPARTLGQGLAQRLREFPRERSLSHLLFWTAWTIALRVVLSVAFGLEVFGRHRIPRSGSYILAANHASHLDGMCLHLAIPLRSIYRVYGVAARDYFFRSFLRSLFASVCLNAVPLDRDKNKGEGLELCRDLLASCDCGLVMFPEGTRSLTGEIQAFKKGIGVLAAGAPWPVVPAYIDGAWKAWPKGARLPRPRRLRVYIGEPLSFRNVPRDPSAFLHVAHTVESHVRRLEAEARLQGSSASSAPSPERG